MAIVNMESATHSVEDLIVQAGGLGLYQILVLMLFGAALIAFSMNKTIIVFLMDLPNHRCSIPSFMSVNMTEDQLKAAFIPHDANGDWSSCKMYAYPVNLTVTGRTEPVTVPCQHGWTYDSSTILSSVSTKYDLVCDSGWLRAAATASYLASEHLGAIVFGLVSDMLGRRKLLIATTTVALVGAWGSAFSFSYLTFLFTRAVMGFANMAMSSVAYVSSAESVSSSHRVPVYAVCNVFWVVGFVGITGMAYLLRNETWLMIFLAAWQLLFLLNFIFAPESFRWQFGHGKMEDGEATLRKIAKINRKTLPKSFKVSVDTDIKKSSMIEFMKKPRLRMRFFVSCAMWTIGCCVFTALNLNPANLGGNLYVNMTVTGLVELPAHFLSLYLSDRVGRLPTAFCSFFLAGVNLLITIAIPSEMVGGLIALSVIGKLLTTLAFSVVFLYTIEVAPTVVRNTCVSLGFFFSGLGTIFAPFMTQLSRDPTLPMIICGVLALIASIISLYLPETMGTQLPETLEEGENFDLDNKLKLFFRIKRLLTREKGPRVEISVIHATTVTTTSMEYDAEIIRTHL